MNDRLINENDTHGKPEGVQLRSGLVLTAIVAVIGLAGFAGWFANGDSLFWSMLQAGLAWCL